MCHKNFVKYFSDSEQIVYNYYSDYFTDIDIKACFAKNNTN